MMMMLSMLVLVTGGTSFNGGNEPETLTISTHTHTDYAHPLNLLHGVCLGGERERESHTVSLHVAIYSRRMDDALHEGNLTARMTHDKGTVQ